jgi:hypothetical protein
MMDDFDRPATQAEAYQEMVGNIGSDNPDNEWILTPYDTWERNPAYTGPRGPHPEDLGPDDCYDIGGLEFREELSDEELEALTAPVENDDAPF